MATVFEELWNEHPENALFISEVHGVGVWADAFPKLPLQTVIIPDKPYDGVRYEQLPTKIRALLGEVTATIMQASVEAWKELHDEHVNIDTSVRAHSLVSGFGVTNHAHIVVAPAIRREFSGMWDGTLSNEIQQKLAHETRDVLQLGALTQAGLNARLSAISQLPNVQAEYEVGYTSHQL